MRTLTMFAVGVLVMTVNVAAQPPIEDRPQPPIEDRPQPGPQGFGERVGEQLDRGVERLGQQLRRGWAEVRQTVDELGVEGRVYGRLHWDKALTGASIDVEVQGEGIVMLTGTVADEAARRKAVSLARDTVGVHDVVNQLAIAPSPVGPTTSTGSPDLDQPVTPH